MGARDAPGPSLFPGLLRHAAFCTTRFEARGTWSATGYAQRPSVLYKSLMAPFAECAMLRVPVDPPDLRRKLDGQWLKGLEGVTAEVPDPVFPQAELLRLLSCAAPVRVDGGGNRAEAHVPSRADHNAGGRAR